MPSLEKFLARLTEEARRPFPAYNVAAIFAHPSEIIAGGATLRRLRGAHLVVVTDGVPHGYHECGALSASGTRWHELLAAAELAGHRPSAVSGLAVSQGEAAEHLVSIGRRLARIFARQGTAIALAPAYEADDPDRDATAFAVRKGAQLCRQRGQDIAVIEMPFAAKALEIVSPAKPVYCRPSNLNLRGRLRSIHSFGCGGSRSVMMAASLHQAHPWSKGTSAGIRPSNCPARR